MKYSSKAEIDALLKEKYGNAFGSPEWAKERAELLASSGLK